MAGLRSLRERPAEEPAEAAPPAGHAPRPSPHSGNAGGGTARRGRDPLAAGRCSLEHLRHPGGLPLHIVGGCSLASRGVGGGHRRGPLEARHQRGGVLGIDQHSGLGVTNSGGPPTVVARTVRSIAIPSRVAWPKGSRSDGWQSTSHAATHSGTSDCGIRPVISTPALPLELISQGPSPTNASRPRPTDAKASASRTTFLRSISEPTQRNAGPSPTQPRPTPSLVRRVGGERIQIDPAVRDRDLLVGDRDPLGKAVDEPARVGDHRRRSAQDPGGRPGHAGESAQVRDVLTMGHHDQGRAWRSLPRAPPPLRPEEEMGEDNIRPSPLCRRAGSPGQARVLGGQSTPPADRGDHHFVSESPNRGSTAPGKLPRSGFFRLGHIWVTSRILIQSRLLRFAPAPYSPTGDPIRRL